MTNLGEFPRSANMFLLSPLEQCLSTKINNRCNSLLYGLSKHLTRRFIHQTTKLRGKLDPTYSPSHLMMQRLIKRILTYFNKIILLSPLEQCLSTKINNQCNSLLYGLSKHLINTLLSVQNAATLFFCTKCKNAHILILKQLTCTGFLLSMIIIIIIILCEH